MARNLSRLMAPLIGITVIKRFNSNLDSTSKVFIGNHQNTYDLATISAMVSNNTVCVGKKSIRWIPFFGPLFWLSGNILIDRLNKSRARETINQVALRLSKQQLCVWLFPEGTRSNGKGLLPFKMGAFHTAIQAKVAIVPVVLSSTSHIKLNKWNNGYVIAEVLDPIETKDYYSVDDAKQLASLCHQKMQQAFTKLNQEACLLNR